ncbi:MAG TPA: multiple cyclophane-containing RiPP AmcA [Pilimelia sp.]|nr:multiple cyclophane-containing RiPP AmcA [Pilimelia sp.]
MPETTSPRSPEAAAEEADDALTGRVQGARAGLTTLLAEAERARRARAEAERDAGSGAVCAWNHFENIPTFYNWNNRPR